MKITKLIRVKQTEARDQICLITDLLSRLVYAEHWCHAMCVILNDK